MSSGKTYRPPAVRTPNATATAYSASWVIETATRPIPSCSARPAARPWRTIDGWPVGSRSTSMSFQPTPRTPEAQDLGHGLLGGPATGERLGSLAHVALLARGQDPVGEALPEPRDRGRDPVDLDDVDAQLVVPGGTRPAGVSSSGDGSSVAIAYSTVTDFARFRGWSTSVPRATAV